MPLEEEEEAEDEDDRFMQEDYHADRNIEDQLDEREAQDLGNEVVSGSEQEYDLTPEEV